MLKAPRYSLRSGNDIFFNPISVGDSMVKTASDMKGYSPETAEAASNIKPKDGMQYVLINAVSSYEYWGANINADGFKEEEFTNGERHKTFMTHAHPYRNHVNKDSSISYGKVMHAAFNPRMHRVELICEYDRKKADDICKRIDENEDVRVSMGCRVAYDVCSICGNKAKTTADYCEHLRGEMKKIYPDGRIVCAFNPNPTFFDISVVWIPADKTARILYKIASDGMYKSMNGLYVPERLSEDLATDHGYSEEGIKEATDKSAVSKSAGSKMAELAKKAIQRKVSEIKKDIPAEVAGKPSEEEIEKITRDILPSLRDSEPDIPSEKLDDMADKFPLGKILSALGLLGIIPKPKEFQRMFMTSHGNHSMADEFDNHGISFEGHIPRVKMMIISGARPEVMSEDMPQSMESNDILSSIIPMLGSLIGEKSYYAAPVTRRVIKITISGMPKEARAKYAEEESLAGSLSGYLMAIAVAYLYAKARTLNLISASSMTGGALDQAFLKNPELASVLLGTGGAGLMAAMKSGMSYNPVAAKTYPSDYLYAKPGTYKEAGAKIASYITPDQSNLITALTLGQLGSHLSAGYLKANDNNDYQQGVMPSHNPIKDIIKQYPGYLGLALATGALYKGLI